MRGLEPINDATPATAGAVITSQPDISDILSASVSLERQEPSAAPGVLPARGLTVHGPVRLPKVHAALGFWLALLVLVALGTVTQASIADLVAANASATRSVEALERLQALKGSLREFEASELATPSSPASLWSATLHTSPTSRRSGSAAS